MMTEPDDLKLKSKTLAQLEDLYQAMRKLGYPTIAKEVAAEIALRRLRVSCEAPPEAAGSRQDLLQSGRRSNYQDDIG